MRKHITVLAFVAIVGVWLIHVSTVYACSASEAYDPIADSDIIVGGQLLGWQPLDGQAQPRPFTPIQVDMAVSQMFKGVALEQLRFVDHASLQTLSDDTQVWVGGAGPCGAFSAAPTGAYAVLGLKRAPDGTYESSILRTFFLGAAPSGDGYQAALALLRARGTDPAATDRRCFPQTGRCLSGRFRQYWEQHGGLEVFGYPITPIRDERNRDTGQAFTTQWFERARFEWHPENQRPYDVLLGRLGADRVQQDGLSDPTIRQPEQGSKPGCRWFAQTGFNVCEPAFIRYWTNHGLEFDGWPGTSHAESLALFGLPVTRHFTIGGEEGSLVHMQYFERARFELRQDPSNPNTTVVMLGLLGTEILAGASASPAQADIAMIDPDGTVVVQRGAARISLAQIDVAAPLTPWLCTNALDLVWSPDGHRLALPGGVRTIGARPPGSIAHAPIAGADYRWSADGKRLAYLTWVGPDTDLLMLADADGANARQVASSHWSSTGHPTWSPDGRQLIAGPQMRVALDGTTSVLAPQEIGKNATWSPDGRTLVWTVSEGDAATLRLRVVQWDGARQSDLAVLELDRRPDYPSNQIWWTDPGWRPPRLAWLPDGHGVLVPVPPEGLRDGGTYLVRTDGTFARISPHQLCDLVPDGRQMLARTQDGTIVIVRLADGAVTAELGSGLTAAWRPAPYGSAPPSPLAERSPTLRLTSPPMHGPATVEAQRLLRELGYDVGPIDGAFGPQTETAVRAFQERNRLAVDGIVGPQTWALLRAPGACPAAGSVEIC
jgi:hypothetical protein